MDKKKTNAECLKCAHFYATWDEFFPGGCKALKIKSREAPSHAVLSASGAGCRKFEAKKRGGAKK